MPKVLNDLGIYGKLTKKLIKKLTLNLTAKRPRGMLRQQWADSVK